MEPKKVLLISIDNLRYDCVGYNKNRAHLKQYYVDTLVDTPTLDEISSNASIFTNFFSTSSYTTSAHASLFTGLYPPAHGVRPFFYKKLNGDAVTLAEVYKKNGYKTIFYTDVFELFEPLGLAKGFDYKTAGNINDLIKQLSAVKDENIFCFVHLFDVHEPYIYSQNYNEDNYNREYFDFMKKMSVLYKTPTNTDNPFALWNYFAGKVHYDLNVMLPPYIYGINKFDKGRFRGIYKSLKEMGYFNPENIFAVFSDHGEGRITMFDQSVFGHMGELYDEVIHLPLIFHAPEIENKIYEKLTSITDIFPTLISLSGLEPYNLNGDSNGKKITENSNGSGRGIDGQSLFEKREFCYSEFYTQNMYNEIMQFTANEYDRNKNGASSKDKYFLSQRAIRTADKKYIFMPDKISELQTKNIIENVMLSDEDYIISIFNDILRKRIGKVEFLQLLNSLKSLKTDKNARLNLYKNITNSDIYNRNLNFYYDLSNDLYEENPINFNPDLTESAKYVEILNNIEKKSVSTENLFDSVKKTGIIINEPKKDGKNESFVLLNQKISLSVEIIKEAYDRFGEKIGIAFTGGKDSSVLLHLVRNAFDGQIPFKIFTIETSVEFQEIRDFIEKLKKEWNFDLLVYTNTEALKTISIAEDKQNCCSLLKTVPIKNAVKELHLKALMTGIRKDENESRANEKYFSKREAPHHYRVHPILHFTESDIWDYIKLNNIPYCPLYEQGYRSIDCKPCTKITGGEAERSGRSQDKEAAMDKLRQLGYF